MNDTFATRLRAAAAAGWWTVLIGAIWMTLGWLWMLLLFAIKPDWLLTLWGGGELTWSTMHTLALWFFGGFKLILTVALLLVIWLTIWSRRLKRAQR